MDTVLRIRVFLSSPGDCAAERQAIETAIDRINRTESERSGIDLRLVKWESSVTPQLGLSPQAVIDKQTPQYDIYVGILSRRFGTPTDGYGSGTEKEFNDALERFGQTGSPWILFYFNEEERNTPVNSPADFERIQREHEELSKIWAFKEKVKPLGLYGAYKSVQGGDNSFLELVELHLRDVVHELLKSQDIKQSQPGRGPNARKHPHAVKTAKPAVFPEEYLSWVKEQCEELALLGLNLKQGQNVTLRSVYVPLRTGEKEVRTPARGSSSVSYREGRLTVQTSYYRESLHNAPQLLLDLLEKDSLYISGNPGSGKSTFCKWLAWLACHRKMPANQIMSPVAYTEVLPQPVKTKLPLLIRLRDFWPSLPKTRDKTDLSRLELELALANWLRTKGVQGLHWVDAEAHLRNGSALVVFDGVDEVPVIRELDRGRSRTYPRELLLSGLYEAISYWRRNGNLVVVTSRPYGLTDDNIRRLRLPHVVIQELDEDQQKLLIRKWFVILEATSEKGEATALQMMEHILERPELGELAANPMLLTAMCIIYSEGKRLPQDIFDLYARIIDNILHNRYPSHPRAISQVLSQLSVIAYGMHTGDGIGEQRESPQAVATYTEIDSLIKYLHRTALERPISAAKATQFRDELLSNTGLLLPKERDRAEFYHYTFQDFLAARQLLTTAATDDALFVEIAKHAEVPEWRNTLALVFAAHMNNYTTPERSIRLLGRMIECVGTSKHLGLGIVTASCLRILLGKGFGVKEQLKDVFRAYAVQVLQTGASLSERLLIADALGHVGDPRIADGCDASGFVRIPAGTYKRPKGMRGVHDLKSHLLIARYPITNGQYKEFLDSNGYEKGALWTQAGRAWLRASGRKAPLFWESSKWNGPNKPVVGVTLFEAEAYCNWAGCRLPTRIEWTIAVLGGSSSNFPWGNEWRDGICNSQELGLGSTTPVGLFPESRSEPFGLEDAAGNVWEWTCDALEADQDDLEDAEGYVYAIGHGCGSNLENGDMASYLAARQDSASPEIGFRPVRGERTTAKRGRPAR